jgi:hypothetical protein
MAARRRIVCMRMILNAKSGGKWPPLLFLIRRS